MRPWAMGFYDVLKEKEKKNLKGAADVKFVILFWFLFLLLVYSILSLLLLLLFVTYVAASNSKIFFSCNINVFFFNKKLKVNHPFNVLQSEILVPYIIRVLRHIKVYSLMCKTWQDVRNVERLLCLQWESNPHPHKQCGKLTSNSYFKIRKKKQLLFKSFQNLLLR